MRRGLLLIAVLAGCGAGARAVQRTPVGCNGDAVLTTTAELKAVGTCRVYRGSLSIRGSDIRSLAPLAGVEQVTGDLSVVTAFELDAVSGMDGLRRVGGTFKVGGNPIATGAWFPALAHVGGDVIVRGNSAALTVSLHRLVEIGGNLAVYANQSLVRLDLSALAKVAGTVRVNDNGRLDTLAAPPAILRRVEPKSPR